MAGATGNNTPTQVPASPQGQLTPPAGSPINFSDPNSLGLGAVGTTTSGTVYAPGVTSMTPYSLGQLESEAGQITIGPDMAALLNIPPGPYSMADLLADFNALSQDQRIQLQSQLAAGGFYTDSAGQPMPNPPTFGAHDNQSFNAFANALMQTAQLGHTADGKNTTNTIDSVIQTGIRSGQGQVGKAAALSPSVGGGQTYQIDLTNPAAVRESATGLAQTLLGRNPTQDELNKITSYVQGQETAFQGAKNRQAETAQQAVYQANLTAKQAQNAAQVTLGPAPNGPFKDVGQWAAAFLQYLGGGGTSLATPSNIAMIIGWAKASGNGMGGNNPLGVTLAEPGSQQTKGGTQPSTQSYSNPADGMRAAAQTLTGSFPLLLQALQGGDASSQLGQKAIQDELNKWSSGGYRDITSQVAGAQTQANAAAQQYGNQPVPGTAPPSPSAPTIPTGAVGGSQEAKLAGAANQQQQAAGQQAAAAAGPQTADQLAANNPAVAATFAAAQQNPDVAAYLQAGYNQAHGMGATVDPAATSLGQQPVAPGSTYIPATTLTQVQPETPEQHAYEVFTTGANRIEYGANNYLNLFKGLMSLIQQGGFK